MLILAAALVIILAATLLATFWRPDITRWTAVIVVTGIVTILLVGVLWVMLLLTVLSESDSDAHRSLTVAASPARSHI